MPGLICIRVNNGGVSFGLFDDDCEESQLQGGFEQLGNSRVWQRLSAVAAFTLCCIEFLY